MLDLLDYRRRVAATYHVIRSKGTSQPEAFSAFRASRDELFAKHHDKLCQRGAKRFPDANFLCPPKCYKI